MNKIISLIVFCVLLCSCKPNNLETTINIVRFSVDVDTSNPMQNTPKPSIETDLGVLIFPQTYSELGDPTRLIICCHGGGGSVFKNSSQVENLLIIKYFISLGFAVMDMSGMPETLSSRLEIDHNRVLGNYIALRSYEKGYNYVINKYNLKKDGCILWGGSNGGLTSVNLALHTKIPFLTQVAVAPLLNIKDNAWNITSGANSGGKFNSYQNRANIIRLYGMKDVTSNDELLKAVYESDKVGKYDPIEYFKMNPNLKYPIPFRIWTSIDDPIISIRYVTNFTELVNRLKNNVRLEILPYGGHNPDISGDIVDYFELNGNNYPLYKTAYDIGEHIRPLI